jgi:hypothetical protein
VNRRPLWIIAGAVVAVALAAIVVPLLGLAIIFRHEIVEALFGP